MKKSKKPRSGFRTFFVILGIVLLTVGIAVGVFFTWFYPEVFQTVITIPKTEEIQPGETINIDFSYPIQLAYYENKIEIVPSEKVNFSWGQENKKLSISPQNSWKLETEYQIVLPEGKNIAWAEVSATEIHFSTIEYPKVSGFTPNNGAKDVVLDIEDPIIVDFDRPTEDFLFKFSLEPKSEMAYDISSDTRQFRLIPQAEEEPEENRGKKYEVRIYIKHAQEKDTNYKKIYQSNFETLPPTPEEWEKDFILRLAQARRLTLPKIIEGKYIDINIDTQILSTFENGKLIDSYLISSGKKGMWTPTGTFKVHNKHPRAFSRTYGLYMPYWMAFVGSGKFGIHELPEWPGGYKEGANHLGIPVSHGCVRLGVGAAKAVYEWAEVGTPIVIY